MANYRAWQQLVDAERRQPDTPWFRPADNPRLQTPMSPLPFSVPGFGSLVVEFGAGLGQDTTWWNSGGTALPDPIAAGWKPRTGFQTFEDMLLLRGWYNTTREYPEVPGEAPDRRRRRARGYDYANARPFSSVWDNFIFVYKAPL